MKYKYLRTYKIQKILSKHVLTTKRYTPIMQVNKLKKNQNTFKVTSN